MEWGEVQKASDVLAAFFLIALFGAIVLIVTSSSVQTMIFSLEVWIAVILVAGIPVVRCAAKSAKSEYAPDDWNRRRKRTIIVSLISLPFGSVVLVAFYAQQYYAGIYLIMAFVAIELILLVYWYRKDDEFV